MSPFGTPKKKTCWRVGKMRPPSARGVTLGSHGPQANTKAPPESDSPLAVRSDASRPSPEGGSIVATW